MIHVYDIGNEKYEQNGNAILTPTDGKMKVVAGGDYSITMTHPIDPEGKWKHLVPGAVIRIPVPEEEIENAYAGMEADVYKTLEKADLREGPSEPTAIVYPTWSQYNTYSVGSKVSSGGKNYECTYFDRNSIYKANSPGGSDWWKEIPSKTTGSAALVTLSANTEIYWMEDYDTTWAKVTTFYGIVGYVKKALIQYVKHLTPSETKPRIITSQLFRIERPVIDTKGRTVSVTAKHVSYDMAGILIQNVKVTQASPAMAIGRLMDGMMIDYRGTIATNLDAEECGTYTNEIKGKNAIFVLLDPDKGIVSTFDAAYRRDNWDVFVMKRDTVDRGYKLRYGKNVLGINWTRKSDAIITRVVPVAKDESGDDLYLPEMWVDSPHINDYPVIRMEQLSVKGQVGKAKDDAESETWTESDLLEEMRTKAGERFSVDKADEVGVEITVDFEQLHNSYEYPELAQFEKVLLYDTVTVEDPNIGLSVKLYVEEMEWDFVREKITALKLVNAHDYGGKTVTGYNVQAKSISGEKLTDDVAGDILDQVRDMIPEYADPDAARPSSDIHVVDALNSSSTTDALSANQGRVLDEKKADITILSNLTGNSSKSYTVGNSSRILLTLTATNNNVNSLLLIASSSSGAITVAEVLKGSNITITKTTGTLTVANGTSNAVKVAAFIFAGSITEPST